MADRNEPIDWNAEDSYWRTNYSNRPYAKTGQYPYDYYQPGYRYGFESAQRYQGRSWDEVESELEQGWTRYENRSPTAWEQIKGAVRDAWDRVMGRTPAHTR
jgi:hypothetical protein